MIDFTKPVRTKGSKEPVRILCTDAAGPQPVVGIVLHTGHSEYLGQWTLSGGFRSDGVPSCLDLEQVPASNARSGWVNIHRDGGHGSHNYASGFVWPTEQQAIANRGGAVVTVQISWEEPL